MTLLTQDSTELSRSELRYHQGQIDLRSVDRKIDITISDGSIIVELDSNRPNSPPKKTPGSLNTDLLFVRRKKKREKVCGLDKQLLRAQAKPATSSGFIYQTPALS